MVHCHLKFLLASSKLSFQCYARVVTHRTFIRTMGLGHRILGKYQLLTFYNLQCLLQRNAADLERQRIAELKADGRYVGADQPQDHEKVFYPKYDEYEVYAGEDPKTRNDRWKDFKNPYLNSEEEFVTKKKK